MIPFSNLADVLAENPQPVGVHAALVSLDGTGNRSGISFKAADADAAFVVAFGFWMLTENKSGMSLNAVTVTVVVEGTG
jgi:hypothetical protein